jgi:hypothetical protein
MVAILAQQVSRQVKSMRFGRPPHPAAVLAGSLFGKTSGYSSGFRH